LDGVLTVPEPQRGETSPALAAPLLILDPVTKELLHALKMLP